MRRLSLTDLPFLAQTVPSGPAPFVYNGVHAAAASVDNFDVTTPPIDTTGSDLLVFSLGFFFNSLFNISDNKGNTWNPIQTSGGGGLNTSTVYICIAPIVGAGHTFTFSAAGFPGDSPAISIIGFTGGGATNTAINLSTTGGGVTSCQPGAIVPATNNQLFVTNLEFTPNSGMSIDSGFIITDQIAVSGTSRGIATAYKLQTVAASENPTWSWAGSNTFAVSMVTFSR